jgi:hypothetical protein
MDLIAGKVVGLWDYTRARTSVSKAYMTMTYSTILKKYLLDYVRKFV